MARYGDELPLIGADVLLNGVRANLCDLAIDYAGKLIDHNRVGQFEQRARNGDAEAFAGREHGVRSQPCWYRVESHGLTNARNVFDAELFTEIVNDGRA